MPIPVLTVAAGVLIIAGTSFVSLQWSINRQRKEWNNGVSRKSNKPWRLYSRSEKGERGYTDDAGNYLWLSHNVDDGERRKGSHKPFN